MQPGAERPHLPHAGPACSGRTPQAGLATRTSEALCRTGHRCRGSMARLPHSGRQVYSRTRRHAPDIQLQGNSHINRAGVVHKGIWAYSAGTHHAHVCKLTQAHIQVHSHLSAHTGARPVSMQLGTQTHAQIETPAPVCSSRHSLAGTMSTAKTHTHGQVSKGKPHWIQECMHAVHTRALSCTPLPTHTPA